MKSLTFTFLSGLLASLLGQPAAAQWSTTPAQNTRVSNGHATNFYETAPLSATLPDGRRYVAWVEYQSVVSQGAEVPYTVRLQLFAADGRKQWAAVGLGIYTPPPPASIFPGTLVSTFQGYDLQVDAAGNAVLVYSNIDYAGTDGVVWAQKVSPAGQVQWGTGGVAVSGPTLTGPTTSRRNQLPSLALTPAGDAVVAWQDTYYSTTLQKLAAATGQPQWTTPPRLVDATNASTYTFPKVLPDGGTGCLLTYYQDANTSGQRATLLAQHYDATGAPQWAAPVAVSSLPVREAGYPTLRPTAVADAAGGCFLAYVSPSPASPAQSDVYVQHLAASGTRWSATGTPVPLANGAASRVVALRYAAARQEAWLLLGTPASDRTTSGAYLQKFDAAGTAQLGTTAPAVVAPGSARPLAHDLQDAQDGLLVLYSEDVAAPSQPTPDQLLRVTKTNYAAQPAWAAGSVLLAQAGPPKVYATLSAYSAGEVVAVWQDNYRSALDGSAVLAQGLSRTGQLGAYTPLATRAGAAEPPASLYPNPSTSAAVHLTLAQATTVRLTVLDLLGRLVATRTLAAPAGAQALPLPALAPGTYLVQVQQAGTTTTLKWSSQ